MDGLMSRMSTRQLGEWMAAARLDPFPEDRAEYMLAQLTALVANMLTGKDDSFTTSDFLPDYVSSEKERERDRQKLLKAKMAAVKLKRMLTGG